MENLKEGYKKTKIGIIPEDWEVVKLGDVLKYEQPTKYLVKSNNYDDKYNIPVLTAGKSFILGYTNENKGVFKDVPVILFDDFTTETKYVNFPFKVKSSAIKILNVKNKEYPIKFFYECIQLIKFEAITHKRYWISEYQNIKIPLPPLPEQKKIAQILSTWDNAIEKLEELINKKIEYKKGLMEKLLSGELRFPEFKGDWEEVKLEDIVIKMKSGGTPKSTNKDYYDNGTIPFVKVNDITKNGKYLKETEIKITEKGLKNSSAWLVPKNNILYSMYASIGFVSINKIEVATNQAIMCIIPNNETINTEFLYYILDNYRKHTIRFIEQGTQGNLNAKIIKNFKFKIPPLSEQKKIAEILTLQDKEIELLKKKLNLLKEQKKGLMQNLLTGKVRVKV